MDKPMRCDPSAGVDDRWQRKPIGEARGPEPGSVHVWLASLDEPPGPEPELSAALSEDERRRAGSFVHARDARRYRVSRGLLRQLLGTYLGRQGNALRFSYGHAGKPRLANASGAGLEFNLSHTAGWVLIGISHVTPVGVDLEVVRPIPEHADLARQNFASGEVAALAALPANQQLEGFFRCWTRKEAVVKALGTGVSMPLDQFEVTVARDDPRLLSIQDADVTAFQLYSFEPFPGLIAAIALQHPQTPVHFVTNLAVRR